MVSGCREPNLVFISARTVFTVDDVLVENPYGKPRDSQLLRNVSLNITLSFFRIKKARGRAVTQLSNSTTFELV